MAAFFQVDSRGNRLEGYALKRTVSGGDHFVYLRGSDDIAKQVECVLCERHCARRDPGAWSEWTHQLRFDGPATRELADLLELLKTALTVPPVRGVSAILALDFYMVPPDDEGAPWTHTEAGDLVYRKYWKDNPSAQNIAGMALSKKLVHVIERHPMFNAADAVVQVPGSEHHFGERLASTVAKLSEKQLIWCRRMSTDHTPAKQGHAPGAKVVYEVDEDVIGREVIIVDDVFRSGGTMREVAAAAIGAGARRVIGLVGARTMRSS